MKRLFKKRWRYPKLTILILVTILAYFLFKNPQIAAFFSQADETSHYLFSFIAGILFAFGFTTPLAVALFIIINPENILLTTAIGSLGSVIGDLLIFNLIRFSFMDEFHRLEREKSVRELEALSNKEFSRHVRNYLLYIFAGFVIASPLPDEIGVIMLAGLTKIRQSIFSIISFILHFVGIWILFKL